MDNLRVGALAPVLSGRRPPAIYRFGSRAKPASVLADLDDAGWRGFHLDGRTVEDKAGFLVAIGTAMAFPGYFGRNWDALDECITDLEWAPATGYVLLYDNVRRFAGNDPTAWKTARSVLSDAVSYWSSTPTPLYVLLRQSWWYARDVEKL